MNNLYDDLMITARILSALKVGYELWRTYQARRRTRRRQHLREMVNKRRSASD